MTSKKAKIVFILKDQIPEEPIPLLCFVRKPAEVDNGAGVYAYMNIFFMLQFENMIFSICLQLVFTDF